MSWATAQQEGDEALQGYVDDRVQNVYSAHEQRARDRRAAEEEPSYVMDALYGLARGPVAAVDEIAQLGTDVMEVAGMEDQGDVTWLRRKMGMMDDPSTQLGATVQGGSQFLFTYLIPGGVAMKAAKTVKKVLTPSKAKKAAGKTPEKAVGKTDGKAPETPATPAKAEAATGTPTAGRAAGTLTEAAARGAVADAIGFDPYEARLSTLLNDIPALEPVVNDWMASANPNDSSWEGRVKNAIEGLFLGIPAELIYRGLHRAIVKRKAGRPETKPSADSASLEDAAERSAAELETAAMEANDPRVIAEGLPDDMAFFALLRPDFDAGKMTQAELMAKAADYTAKRQSDPVAAAAMVREAGGEVGPEAKAQAKAEAEAAPEKKAEPEPEAETPKSIDDLVAAQRAEVEAGKTTPRAEPEGPVGDTAAARAAQERIEQRAEDVLAPFEKEAARAGAEKTHGQMRTLIRARHEAQGEVDKARAAMDRKTTERLDLVGRMADEGADVKSIAKRLRIPEKKAKSLLAGKKRLDTQRAKLEASEAKLVAAQGAVRELAEDVATAATRRQEADVRAEEAGRRVEAERMAAEVKARQEAAEAESVTEVVKRLGQDVEVTSPAGLDLELQRAFGASSEAGLLDDALRRQGRAAHKRVEEWRTSPVDGNREAVARKAVGDYKKALAERAPAARADAPKVGADAPDRWRELSVREWESVPLMDRWREGMARGKYVAQVAVRAMRDALPEGWAQSKKPGDRLLRARRPEEMETLPIGPEYQGGIVQDVDTPLLVFFEDMDSMQDMDDFIAAVAALSKTSETPQRATRAHEALRRMLIDEYGMGRVQVAAAGGDDPQAALEALAAAADTVRRLAGMATEKGASPEVVNQFLRALQKTQALAHHVAGDFPRARKLMDEARLPVTDVEGVARRLRNHRVLKKEGGSHVRALAGAITYADDLGRFMRMVGEWKSVRSGDVRPGGFRKSAREIWVNSVLSSPATHMRNIVGNLMMPVMQVPQHFIAGVVDRGVLRPKAYTESAREVQAMLAGFVGGWRDALWLGRKTYSLMMAMKRGDPEGTGAVEAIREEMRLRGLDAMHDEFMKKMKIDDRVDAHLDPGATGLPNKVLEWSEGHPWSKAAHVLDRKTRQAIGVPTAMLQAEDVFMKFLSYRMEVHRSAMEQAISTGKRGAALKDAFAELVKRPPDATHARAMKLSHRNTFTQDLPQWGQATLETLNTWPGLRYIVPFFRTPTNIAITAGEYTPGLNRLMASHRQLMAGDRRQRAEAAAKTALGSSILAMGALMAANGQLTGGYPTNPKFRATARRLGKKEYSVRVGDTWFDYRFVGGPFGLTMGVAADLGMAMNAVENDADLDALSAMSQTLAWAVGSLADETWLGSISEFTSMVLEGNKGAAERFISSTARGWTPYSSIADDVRQIADTLRGEGVRQDLRVREGYAGGAEGMGEYIGETLHGALREMMRPYDWWGDKGNPVYDLYGEPITYYRPDDGPVDFGEATGAALSPIAFMQGRTDPLSEAILQYMPSLPRIKHSRAIDGPSWSDVSTSIEIPSDVRQYVQRRAGKLFKQLGDRIVSLKGFERLPSDGARRGQLEQAWRRARAVAMQEAEGKFPDYRRQVAMERLRLRAKAAGGG